MRRLPINQSAKPQLASSTPATNQKPNAGFTASQNGRPRGKSRSWEQLCSHELPLTDASSRRGRGRTSEVGVRHTTKVPRTDAASRTNVEFMTASTASPALPEYAPVPRSDRQLDSLVAGSFAILESIRLDLGYSIWIHRSRLRDRSQAT